MTAVINSSAETTRLTDNQTEKTSRDKPGLGAGNATAFSRSESVVVALDESQQGSSVSVTLSSEARFISRTPASSAAQPVRSGISAETAGSNIVDFVSGRIKSLAADGANTERLEKAIAAAVELKQLLALECGFDQVDA